MMRFMISDLQQFVNPIGRELLESIALFVDVLLLDLFASSLTWLSVLVRSRNICPLMDASRKRGQEHRRELMK